MGEEFFFKAFRLGILLPAFQTVDIHDPDVFERGRGWLRWCTLGTVPFYSSEHLNQSKRFAGAQREKERAFIVFTPFFVIRLGDVFLSNCKE